MNNNLKKRGYTLIEVLSVIIILAIIALITTATVLFIIENSRKEAYKNSSLGVIKAAQLYEAENKFITIDKDGINVSELKLDNNNFISGKVIKNENGKLEVVNLTDGAYCSNGTKENLVVLKGSCDLLDETPPTNIKIVTSTVTTNKIVVIVQAEDLESGIKYYHYSLDGINYTTTNRATIEITGLENSKTYKIYVKVENNKGLISEVVEKEIMTEDIDIPTYSIDKTGWATEKIVTITYPERQEGFLYQYSLDSGSTWIKVENGTTVDVTFNKNGSIIARIYDGTNYKTASTYNVTQIDTTEPTVELSVTRKTTNSIIVKAIGTDDESGIIKYEFAIDNGSYVSNGTNGVYTYTNVTAGNHTLKVRVTNGAGLTKETSIIAAPNDIIAPTYNVDKTGWAREKVVTITYPERQEEFVYQYSLNSGSTWTTVSSGTTATITFTSNGSVIARVYDGTNYKTASAYNVSQIDRNNPTVAFGTNGNSTYAKTWSTTVTVSDSESGINNGTLKYQWTTSTSIPSTSSFTSTFNNGGTISSPSGTTGTYYLWILAYDNAGNYIITRSNAFNLDNTKPVITLNGSANMAINLGTTFTDPGATASDAHSGLDGNVTVSGNVNTNVAGTYTLTYTAKDKAGNTATITRTVNVTIAEAPEKCFSFNSSTGTIIDYSNAADCPKNVIIPSKIAGVTVTNIGNYAFSSKQLTGVTIPSSVTNIGEGAFRYNKLTTVTIPNSVTSIGASAFFDNKLTSVTIPNSITTISPSTFEMNQLTSVTIPSSVKTIGDNAFSDNQLTSISIPNSVTSIGSYAFSSNQLTSITIPSNITTISNGVFSGNKLTSVTIPSGITSIGNYAFYANQIINVNIASTVKTIGNYAFFANQITSVTIPNGVTTIGNYAFSSNKITSVTIPSSVTSIEKGAFENNQLTSVTIPNSVTSIGAYAFDSNKLTTVTIGSGVTSIGEMAFCDNQYTSVTIPSSVTSIGRNAFCKDQGTNRNLTNIINKTGRSFDWGNIINGVSGYNFVTGTVVNVHNNVTITAN